MAKPTLLLDASIYIFQYYFSMPDNWFSQQQGWPTAAVYGYTTFLTKLLEQQLPQKIAACFDESLGSCFRNTIYPEYKSSRARPDKALAFQLTACRQVTQLMGVPTFASANYEADDLLGSLYKRLIRTKNPIAVLTRDKDLSQLIAREQDFLWDYAADKKYYRDDIIAKYGILPQQFSDYLALVGDVSDDIPGVPGIGSKTAQVLLAEMGDLDGLWQRLDNVAMLPIRGARSLAEKLLHYKQQILMAKQLATIRQDLSLIHSVAELKWQSIDWHSLEAFCSVMGFPRLFTRIAKLAV
ncbi:MAG: 5'-3' exonuclease H3TH domain-containing protein [Pseudomonadota bacterium]